MDVPLSHWQCVVYDQQITVILGAASLNCAGKASEMSTRAATV